MRITLSRSCLAMASLLAALGASPSWASDQSRDLPTFTSITSEGAYKMTVNIGQKQAVVVSGSDAALGKITTKVVDNTLVVSTTERSHTFGDGDVVISINVEQLGQFRMEGAGKTTINNISGDRFRLNYQGVGLLKATGKVQNFVLKAEGVGSVDARELNAQHVDVNLQGVGSAKVRASESLRAKLEGIGSLTYYGKPSLVSKSVDGIGRVAAGD